ncbi:MAG TPA: tetratricopeptide repeat protein [Ohtaekwangia sp.]|uniref:ATP-binding protein n=1 Tax=Ohtaekwangia sp. TaxID=2066019 RepID=UPI002F931072
MKNPLFNSACILTCISLFSFLAVAAQSKTDSLETLLKKLPADTIRVNILIDLAREQYRGGDTRTSLQTSAAARSLAQHLGYTKGIGDAGLVAGYAHIRNSEYDSALREFDKAQTIFNAIHYTIGLARAEKFIGQAYEFKSDYNEALRHYNRSLELYKNTSDQEGLASILNSIGINYFNHGSYEIALDYYFQSLKISESIHSDRVIGSTLNNMGVVYQELQQPKEALYYYRRYLEHMKRIGNKSTIAFAMTNVGGILTVMKRDREAKEYLEKALKVQEEIQDRRGIIYSLCFMADIYRHESKFILAEKNYTRSLILADEIQDQEISLNPIEGLSQLYILQRKFQEADMYLDRWKQVAQSLGTQGWLEQNYLIRSRLDSARGNFNEAYASYKRYTFLKDSLFDIRKSQQIAAVRGLYETERKDKKIQSLSDARKMEALQRASDRKFFITAIGIFILIVLGMLYWLRHKMKTERLLTQQKEEISRTNEEMRVLLEKIEHQNQMLAAKNESLEDLHLEKDGMIGVVAHDLRSPLNKVVGLASVVELSGSLNTEQQDMLNRMRAVCQDGNALIQDLMEINKIEDPNRELRAEYIDVQQFINELISNYRTQLDQKQITLRSIVEPESITSSLYMDPVCLVRILDNLLTNAIKFSPAGKVISVIVQSFNEQITITINDEGPGFHPSDLPHLFKKFKKLSARPTAGESSTGLGLSIVKALVNKTGGTIEVASEWGKGASFKLTFPVAVNNTVPA